MKEALIKLAIFSAGVGVGIFGSMRYFDNKYQKLADEEIASCKAIFEKRTKNPIKEEDSEETQKVAEIVQTAVIYSKDDDESVVSYSEYYAPKNVEEAKTLAPTEDEPFDISLEEYEEDNEFQKVTLDLYLEDGVLVYEESEGLAEEADTVGVENLDDFSRASFSTAYFRNPKSGIDYEVVKVDGSYRELIAGM